MSCIALIHAAGASRRAPRRPKVVQVSGQRLRVEFRLVQPGQLPAIEGGQYQAATLSRAFSCRQAAGCFVQRDTSFTREPVEACPGGGIDATVFAYLFFRAGLDDPVSW